MNQPATLAAPTKPTSPNLEFKVGDILVAEWGDPMQMVSFYQIRKLCGSQSVQLEQIDGKETRTGYLSGTTIPVPNQFVAMGRGKGVMVRRVKNGKVYIESYIIAKKYDPTATYFFDHCD